MTEDTTSEPEFKPSEYDTTITRTFDAPREAVWTAWTEPEHVAEWWGPHEFTVPTCEVDARPGGRHRIDMKAPDGTIYPFTGEFLEVEEPKRLVMVGRAFEDENGAPQLETRHTVTFEDQGDKTRLTLEAEVLSASPAMEESLGGMEIGWSQSFEKLEGYLDESGGALA